MNLSFFIARRYMLRQKGAFSSFIIRLAIVATALSVATMVLSVAVITGFKYEIREKLFSFWGHVHITPFTPNVSTIITVEPMQKDGVLEQKIKTIPHVVSISSFAVRPGIINANQVMEGLQLKGVDEGYKFPSSIKLTGKGIDYADTSYSKEILLSQTTADRLQVKPGEQVQMYFLDPGATFPRIRRLKVAGIFHTGMEEVDRHYGICDIRLLQRMNNWAAGDINGYQVMLDNYQKSDSVSMRIFNDYIQPPLTTNTMTQIFPNIFDWLQLQDVNGQVILIIMAVVAIMNLAVALLILIVEQTRMVGLLKTQGMTFGGIQQIFLYHAGLIAGAGILLGNLIAAIVYWLQIRTGFLKLSETSYYVSEVPVRLLWWQPLAINIATLLLCILCMWLPSLYIRRIQPAKVLQFK
jgi:lipoprotein-releasing system permease protein